MRFFRTYVVAAVAAVVLVGCTQAPAPVWWEQSRNGVWGSTQGVMSGVDHWRILAGNTAVEINECIHGSSTKVPGKILWEASCDRFKATTKSPGLVGRPIYVEPADGSMPFGRVFREALQNYLMNQGLDVVGVPSANSLTLRYRTHLLLRDGNVPLNSVPGNATMLTAAAGAYKALTKVRTSWKSAALLIGGGALIDLFSANNNMGGAQVVVTLALVDGDKFVMRRTGAYYIHDQDISHYASNAPTEDLYMAYTVNPNPPKSRTFNVVAE